jgi:hypothetical protein
MQLLIDEASRFGGATPSRMRIPVMPQCDATGDVTQREEFECDAADE